MSKRRRRKQLWQLGPDGLPQPLKWRPRVRVFGLISGAIGGLGAVVLIQQYGIAPLGRALTLQGLIGGALFGVVVPSVVFAFVVRKYNRKLAEARGRLPPGPAGSPGVGVTVLFVLLIGTAFGAGAAHAEGQGPCRLIVEGRDVASLNLTASDAILVESESSFIASMSWPSDFASFEVRFFYMGFSYGFGDSEVDEDTSDGGADSGTVELPVDQFFQYAGGLYEVHVNGVLVNGQSCNFAMLFDVDRNPLDTVVGKVAAATAAVGAIGVLGVGAAAAVDGTRLIGDLTSVLDTPKGGTTVFDTSGPAPAPDTTGDGLVDQVARDGPSDRVPPVDDTGPADATSPSAKQPGLPGGTAGAAEAGPETKVIPDTAMPAGEAVSEPKVSSGTSQPAADSARGPKVSPDPPSAKVSPDTSSATADGPPEPPTSPIAVGPAADSGPRPAEIPVQPTGDAGPDGAVVEPDPGNSESAADEVPSPDPTIVEPTAPATWEPGGGVPAGKVGMAAGAILTPALLGSLEGAAKARSSGAPSATTSFWFYVAEPTPLFGLEDYSAIVGELSPGSWYLGQGTYDAWVHAVDSASNVEGWVTAQAAQPAS